jgi:hypothetical protein
MCRYGIEETKRHNPPMVRNCPSEITSQRRSFFVVLSIKRIHPWEYIREKIIIAMPGMGMTWVPSRRIMAPAEMFITVRILLLRSTPTSTGMVATPVAESPLRSLMSGSTEATNVQQKMNKKTIIEAVSGLEAFR